MRTDRIIKRVYHLALYLSGIAVLLAAVAISVIRLALPGIGERKDDIEAWVSRYMGQALVIESISADWRGWIPRLYLKGLHLYSEDAAVNIINFDSATLEISPLRSLWKRYPVPRRLMISGLQVSVTRLASGAILVEGVNIAAMDAGHENEFARWLFEQERMDIDRADILWIDHKYRQTPVRLTGASLNIRTDNDRLQLMGSAKLPERYGSGIHFALEAAGDLWSSEWSGDLYTEVEQLNPDNWSRAFHPARITLSGGSADVALWSSWENAKPRLLQGRLKYSDFSALADGETLRVEELAGQFRGEKHGDGGWHVSLKLERLATENGDWPVANIEIAAQAGPGAPSQRYALGFDYVKLADLLPFTTGLEALPEALRPRLGNGAISAELGQGLIIHDATAAPGGRLVYDLDFRNLSAGMAPGQAQINRLSGRLRGSDSRAILTLSGSPGEFHIPSLYDNRIAFSRITGALSWLWGADGWTLHTDELSLEAGDFSLTLRGDIEKAESGALPHLRLAAGMQSDRLENLFRYLPHTPEFKIRDWMQKSLLGGYMDSAIAVIRGYPDEFPFRDNNGRLQAIVNVSDAVVEYSPHWPLADQVDAELLFDNEKMTAVFRRGKVFDAELTGGTGIIADLTRKPRMVDLDGRVRGGIRDLSRFISRSPLAEDSMLKYANETLVSGSMKLDLDLSIPVKAPDLQSAIAGTLELDGAKLYSEASGVELDDIRGNVRFTRDSVVRSELSARFAEQPVTLHLSGAKDNAAAPPTFAITGHASDAFIMGQIRQRFPGATHFISGLEERISGGADWQARFVFQQTPRGLTQHFEISSDLYGLALDLPRPAWKPTYARKKLTIGRTLQAATPTELSYGSVIKARITPHRDNPRKLERLDLFLGGGLKTAHAPAGPGINLSGYLEDLKLDEWRETLALFSPEQAQPDSFFESAKIRMALETDLLSVFGQSFRKTSLLANRASRGWRIDLRGEDVAGEIFLPGEPSADNRITLDLAKLSLAKPADNSLPDNQDPKTLPALRIDAADFTYGDYQLGGMRLVTSPTPAGASFDSIEFVKPGLHITGTGAWEKSGGRNHSRFNISLEADTFDKMLDTFGYGVTAIKDAETTVSITNAGWEGAPYDFSLDELTGGLDLRLKKGQLLEVSSPTAGRLFGLLSIQTLPRRLSLDFTDLLGKGLAFDKIQGEFNIDKGHAYTNGLHLSGPSADVLISGRTGLIDQDYDQLVTVTPQFADNLPVAGALLGPVGIGVGAVLYLAGNMFDAFGSNIDKMLSYQYTIKGNWYNPKIEKLKDQPPANRQVNALPAPQSAYP